MGLKNFWSKVTKRLRIHKLSQAADYQPQINGEGLITQDVESAEPAAEENVESGQVLVKTVQPPDKTQSLEKLQAGFNRLIDIFKALRREGRAGLGNLPQ